jgi:hypothetical protein
MDLQPKLQESQIVELQAVARYLESIRSIYHIFNDNADEPMSGKIERLQKSFKYLESLGGSDRGNVTSTLLFMLRTTIAMLQRVFLDRTDIPAALKGWNRLSFYGTNVVEHFFSIIRRKVLFPNLWEYSYTFWRAVAELVKKNAADRPFPMPRYEPKDRKYNDNSDIAFEMSDVPLVSRGEKKRLLAEYRRQYGGGDGTTEADMQAARTLSTEFSCARQSLPTVPLRRSTIPRAPHRCAIGCSAPSSLANKVTSIEGRSPLTS